jgi:hypothetical protein
MHIQEYIAFYFPIPAFQMNICIVQYPYTNTQIIRNLRETFGIEYSDYQILEYQYQGWNLGGLAINPKDRWNLTPPLLEVGGTWKKDLILGKKGLEANLDPHFDIYNLTHTEAELLGYIQSLSTMDDSSLEIQLNRQKKAFLADWKKMLRKGLITRFPIFSNIGLGSWVFFFITNLRENHLRKVIQHFKFFPYANIFYSEKAGIVVGCVNLPSQWTHTFLHRLASISDEFPSVKTSHYIGPNIIGKWSINIMETFDWKRYNSKT